MANGDAAATPSVLEFERIAFITRAYPQIRSSLQFFWAALFLPWAIRADRMDYPPSAALVALLLLCGVFLLTMASDKWMNVRFGRVVIDREPSRLDPWRGALYGGSISILLKLEEAAIAAGGPSIVLLLVAAVALWYAIQHWPFRSYLVIFVLVSAAGATLLTTIDEPGELMRWRGRVEVAAAMTWVGVCALDVVLLNRVLRKERHADTV